MKKLQRLIVLGALAAPLVLSLLSVTMPKIALFLAAIMTAGFSGPFGLAAFAAIAAAAAAGLQAGTGAFGISLL